MRLTLLLALVLLLGACAPGAAIPSEEYDWGWRDTPEVVVTPPAVEPPPITLDPIHPPVVLPPVVPPEVIDPPEVVDPPVAACRERVLPPRAAVERVTKCPGEPARLTRRR